MDCPGRRSRIGGPRGGGSVRDRQDQPDWSGPAPPVRPASRIQGWNCGAGRKASTGARRTPVASFGPRARVSEERRRREPRRRMRRTTPAADTRPRRDRKRRGRRAAAAAPGRPSLTTIAMRRPGAAPADHATASLGKAGRPTRPRRADRTPAGGARHRPRRARRRDRARAAPLMPNRMRTAPTGRGAAASPGPARRRIGAGRDEARRPRPRCPDRRRNREPRATVYGLRSTADPLAETQPQTGSRGRSAHAAPVQVGGGTAGGRVGLPRRPSARRRSPPASWAMRKGLRAARGSDAAGTSSPPPAPGGGPLSDRGGGRGGWRRRAGGTRGREARP